MSSTTPSANPEERRRIVWPPGIAFAVVDSTGVPVAVLGIWDQYRALMN
ncbi:MAG: hypothetical protein IPI33_16620 [Dehalococcoidia bacterium]|nr:hypothetical protein [Dehalococcoidia bacterium]